MYLNKKCLSSFYKTGRAEHFSTGVYCRINRIVFSLFLMLFNIAALAQTYSEPFWDQELPRETRIRDLLSRLTVDEKISLLLETSPGIPRLGVPKYFMGNEALHGVVRPGKFTVFPQAIGLAATWNTDLMYRITTAISDEARGRWNELQQGNLQKDLYSDLLVFWSPDINLARDPRWGRTQETYGEDPFLSAKMAVAFVKGLQGNDPDYLKVVATPKHYTANNEEHNRFYCDARFSERSLREYYLVPFEYAVKEGKAQSIMSAYNAINGIPCTASKKLLTDILRNEWGFNGFVVSDCGAPGLLVTEHKYAESFEQSAVACMNAGLDLECAGWCGPDCFVYKNSLKPAFDKGWVKESQIDTAAYRVLRARFKLGVFDRDLSSNHYNRISPSVVGCREHQQLALEAARQSVVLLKNGNNILPLNKSEIKSVAVFGPNAANCVFGGYSAKESANEPVSVLQALKDKLGAHVKINYVPWADKDDIEFPIISRDYFHTENGEKGLFAEYYLNKNLEGTPQTRIDACVDFNPKQQAPDPLTPWGKKSIRWTGILTPKISGIYTIAVNSDDGVRLFIDDNLFINQWVYRYNTRDTIQVDLTAGKAYKIKLEYYDNDGEAIAQLRWKVPGYGLESFFKEEKAIAAKSDYVIAVLGLNTQIEDEGQDKKDLDLPEGQQDLIRQIYDANPNTVVVLESGSPLAVTWINDNIPAVVNAWYAGEQGGNAIAEVLFGDYNPAGRLPLTYYKSTNDLLPFDDYEIMKGRTYMYSDKEPLYPFGYGLSYTRFKYSGLKLSKPALSKEKDSVFVSVNIKNTGAYDGDEVVQLYVVNNVSQQPQPVKALRGFTRVSLKRGESKTVRIPLTPDDLRTFDEGKNRFVTDPGTYEIQVGASSQDIRLKTKLKLK